MFEMVRIWQHYRAKGMGGMVTLPDAGGIMDQSSLMMDALAIMDRAEQRLKKVE